MSCYTPTSIPCQWAWATWSVRCREEAVDFLGQRDKEQVQWIVWKPSIGPGPTLTQRRSPKSHSDAWTVITPQERKLSWAFDIHTNLCQIPTNNNLEFKIMFNVLKFWVTISGLYLPSWWRQVWAKMWRSCLSSSSFKCFQIIFHFLSDKLFLHYLKKKPNQNKFLKMDCKVPQTH